MQINVFLCGQINTKLIMLGHKISQKKVEQYINNEIKLQPQMLNIKGRVGWDSKLAKNRVQPPRQLQSNEQTGNKDDEQIVVLDAIEDSFKCPKCEFKVPGFDRKFDKHELDNTIKCQQCNSNTKVLRWNCRCGSYWHKCQKHLLRQQLSDQNINNKRKPPNQTQKVSHKAQCQKMLKTHKELVAYDLKREDREAARLSKRKVPPTQWVTLKKYCLSKGLCERFAHLLINQ